MTFQEACPTSSQIYPLSTGREKQAITIELRHWQLKNESLYMCRVSVRLLVCPGFGAIYLSGRQYGLWMKSVFLAYPCPSVYGSFLHVGRFCSFSLSLWQKQKVKCVISNYRFTSFVHAVVKSINIGDVKTKAFRESYITDFILGPGHKASLPTVFD